MQGIDGCAKPVTHILWTSLLSGVTSHSAIYGGTMIEWGKTLL